MSLREQAATDLHTILTDQDDFGWPITVTDPDGTSASLVGFSGDIFQTIDPDTGQAIAGRNAHVAISKKSLSDAGLGEPRGIADNTIKPWKVSFDDTNGVTYNFKVLEAMPDRTIGVVTCMLEAYVP